MSLAPGFRVGSYEVVALIGAGGMGEVYRARDLKLDRDVALKVLPDAVANDAERLARFEREAKTLAAVNHAHIAQVFGLEDFGATNGAGRAIVMEFVEGDDLAQVIARGAIAPGDAIAMAHQIAEALEAAHDHGIVHRDLKPANIRLRRDGTIKVLDFGLAKAIDLPGTSAPGSLAPTITTPAMTTAGTILGTAAYMSPEQAKGKFIDRRTDIWAFGAVLFEMLTATRAFEGEDVTDTIVALISKEPQWSRVPAGAPAPVQLLLRRCLEKDPRRRLRDIGEARILISDLITGRTEPDGGATIARPVTRSMWRRALPVITTVVIMSLVGVAAWSRLRPPAAAAVARLVVPLADGWPFVRVSNRMLALSPDGSKLVYIGRGQLYVRPIGDFESSVITGSANTDPTDPFFSPDGQWVGFYSVSDRTVKKIAVNGGAAVTIAPVDAGVGGFQGGEWSGDEILYAAVGRGIMRVSANGGEAKVWVAVAPPASAFGPQRLPGGALMFALAADESPERWDKAEVVVVTPSTGERKTILRGAGAPRYLSSGHLAYVVGGTLKAVPFDLERLEITGEPIVVLEDVRRTVEISSGAAQYAVSSAGHAAYIPGAIANTTQRSIVLMDQSGAIQSLGIPPGQYSHPRVSPDGKQFAVSTSAGVGQPEIVWVADVKGERPLRRLSFAGNSRFPFWSRNSQQVLYTSDREGQPALYSQSADGGGVAQRVFAHPGLLRGEAVHPDGRTLLVILSTNGGDIGTVAPDGTYSPLVDGPAIQYFASVSPDGRWFSYSSSEGGSRTQLFVEPFPRTGARYQVSMQGGGASLWTPDGRRLIFHAALGVGEVDHLASANVRTLPGFSFEAPVPLESAGAILGPSRNFDITPDGRQLMLIRPVTADVATKPLRQQINIVLHLSEELNARAPARR